MPRVTKQARKRLYGLKYKKPLRKSIKKFVKKSNKMVTINRTPKNMHMPIAPKFRTKLVWRQDLYSSIANANTAFYFDISLNTLDGPAEISSNGNFVTQEYPSSGDVAGGLTLLTKSSTANNAMDPIGFNVLNQLYQQYKVYGVAYRITAFVSNVQDTCSLVAVPYCKVNNNSLLANKDYMRLQNMPWSKESTVGATVTGKASSTSLQGYVNIRNVIGKNKMQYDALPYRWSKDGIADSTSGTLTKANALATTASEEYNFGYEDSVNLGIAIVDLDNDAFASIVKVRLELTYYCEFNSPYALATSSS